MALEESTDGLERIESNGVTAFIDGSLKEYIEQHGALNIDYVKRTFGGGGFMVTIGQPGDAGCGTGGGCSTC